ncbi:MAG: AraC family transcriptional regulator [Bacteroidota bacterium]
MLKKISLSVFVLILVCLNFAYGEKKQTSADSLYHTRILIKDLPGNTPHDASIYLAASYKGWFPDVKSNKFIEISNGDYLLVLHHNQASFEYKITRGSWDAVEGRSNGRARPNRIFNLATDKDEIILEVQSWEDLSKGSYNTYVYLLYLAVIQAILLIFAINTIRNKNKQANGVLSILLLLIAIALIGRASTYDRDIFNWAPKMLLTPEIILFTYAPVFYIYIHYLLKKPLPFKKYWWLHFAPAIIHILLYIPYLQLNNQTFIYRVIDKDLFPVFATSGAVAMVFNLIYWLQCFKIIKKEKSNEKENKKYQKYIGFLNVVLRIKAVYLVLWIFLSVVFLIGRIWGIDTLWVSEFSLDVLWVLFSLIIVCLAYYAMKQPEIFTREEREQKYKDSTIASDEFDKIKNRLNDLVDREKIYINPELTLPELSNQIPTSVHTLSRVINEGFNQTFSQFINEKRVLEFIQCVETGKEYDSFLSLAYSVGFNSKATFNRSFKKYTGTTPRLYFAKQEG